MKPQIRKPYHTGKAETIPFPEKGKTDDSFGNDTDVNKIVARFARTGMLPEGNPGQYANVTSLQGDLAQLITDSKNAIAELNQAKKDKEQNEKIQINEKLEKLQALEAKLDRIAEAQPEHIKEGGKGEPGGSPD